MMDDLVDPGEQEMRLEIVPFGEFSALGRVELLHGASVPPRLLGGEPVDRVDEAVVVVALDLRLGQHAHSALADAAEARRQNATSDETLRVSRIIGQSSSEQSMTRRVSGRSASEEKEAASRLRATHALNISAEECPETSALSRRRQRYRRRSRYRSSP